MPGITITPGTFNPVGIPVQTMGIGYFPKTVVGTVRKWQQFSPKWVGELEPIIIPLPVIYSTFDFTTGDLTVGVDVETFDASATSFTTSGVRYVGDGSYIKTAHDSGAMTYSAVGTPPFAGGGSIDIGLVEAEYGGDFAMPSNHIRVLVEFSLTVSGTADGSFYSTSLVDYHPDPVTTLTGEIWLTVPYPVDPSTNGYINQDLDLVRNVVVTLLRDGTPFDRIYLAIPITGEVSFTLIPGTPGADLDIPVVDSGLAWSDTLYGATASGPAGSEPDIPYASYVRESWASEGEVTLP
jgi:hypothetical protein